MNSLRAVAPVAKDLCGLALRSPRILTICLHRASLNLITYLLTYLLTMSVLYYVSSRFMASDRTSSCGCSYFIIL